MRYKPKPEPECGSRRTLENFFVLWPRWDRRKALWVWFERVTLVQSYGYSAWWTIEVITRD